MINFVQDLFHSPNKLTFHSNLADTKKAATHANITNELSCYLRAKRVKIQLFQ